MRLLTAASLALVVLVGPALAQAKHPVPTPGADGVGDRLFPQLGNGGYLASSYDIVLRYAQADGSGGVRSRLRMEARSTQALSRFNLDFQGERVDSVEVAGKPAVFARSGGELVITPDRALRKGERFTVTVSSVARPRQPQPGNLLEFGWLVAPEGSVVAASALDPASTIYPNNNHPSDKASYRFTLDVPAGVTAVASGALQGVARRDGRTIWSYRQREPLPSDAVQIAVGDFEVLDRGRSQGVRLRDVVPRGGGAPLEAMLALTPDHLEWTTARLGRYPFSTYGALASSMAFNYAVETQTLSMFPTTWFTGALPADFVEQAMVHELVHQWFGNDVAPERWSDLWLNEGPATWFQFLYAAELQGLDLDATFRDFYADGDRLRAQAGPVAQPVASDVQGAFESSAFGGAVTLYALRELVGEDTLGAILRAWVKRYSGQSAGTEEFIALASKVAHRDLSAFLNDWLFGTRTPPMPGHPDWTVDQA